MKNWASQAAQGTSRAIPWVVVFYVIAMLAFGYVVMSLGLGALLVATAAAVALMVVFAKPSLGPWLLAVAAVLPASTPRLFGAIGPMELVLAALLGVVVVRALYLRRTVRFDSFLSIMLLIAVPFALSAISGRGELDARRLYVWGGSCLAYFVTLNLSNSRKTTIQLLLLLAATTAGLVLVDFLLVSGTPVPETDYGWARDRSLATSAGAGSASLGGHANYVVSLPNSLIAIPIAVSVLLRSTGVRIACTLLIGCNVALAVMVQTRAFFLISGASILAMMLPVLKRRGVIALCFLTVVFVAALGAAYQLFPSAVQLLGTRLLRTFAIGDHRFKVWQELLMLGAEAPVLGHGAQTDLTVYYRYGALSGHGLLPHLFFEYGFAALLPTLALLGLWVRNSWQLLKRSRGNLRDSSTALAMWGVTAALMANAVINVHLLQTASYSVLAFCTAGLVNAQLSSLPQAKAPRTVQSPTPQPRLHHPPRP